MESFANNQNQAEQGVPMPMGEMVTPRPLANTHPTTDLRPTAAPSSQSTRASLSGAGTIGPTQSCQERPRRLYADTVSGTPLPDHLLRYKHQVGKHRLGWPRFAATQEARHNGGIYRRFGWLTSRVLLYKQSRLQNLQEQLEEHEGGSGYNPKGLSAGQTRKVGEEYTPDQLDLIMAEMEELTTYLDLLTRDRETQSFLPALSQEVEELYIHVGGEQMLDEAGFRPARELSDFVFTRHKLAYNGLRRLIYSDKAEKLLRPLFGGRELSSAAIRHTLQALVAGFGAFMLLGPTGLMYLLELGKSGSFGLVVGFVVVFSVAFVVAGATFEHVLIGVCAYVAVLSGILVQTQGGLGVGQ